MEKKLYVIHRYVESQIETPLGFHNEETAYQYFNKLSNELIEKAGNDDGIEKWDEIGGLEIACMSYDTIYRLCEHNIIDEEKDTFAYTEYQDGKYYQLRNVGVSTYGALRKELKGFIEEFGKDEDYELVDSGVDFAKFATNELECISEAYVQEIHFMD